MARILIIDDEPQVRRMLRQMFERSGYEVVDAPNGKDAIEFHRQHPADLVITDIIMPTKEGIETIIEFKLLFQGVKVIAFPVADKLGRRPIWMWPRKSARSVHSANPSIEKN